MGGSSKTKAPLRFFRRGAFVVWFSRSIYLDVVKASVVS